MVMAPINTKFKNGLKKKNISDKVLWMGVSKNPMRDISNDGMFLITSDYEGISNSLFRGYGCRFTLRFNR